MSHPSNRFRLGLVIYSALAFSLISPARLGLFAWSQSGFIQVSRPSTLSAPLPISQADLNSDGRMEQVVLHDGVASIRRADQILWSTPSDWLVKQALITDLNLDGQPEVSLLLWRAFAPWPIDRYLVHPGRIESFQDSAGQSCHLILIGWRRDAFVEIWAGSALADPLVAIATADLDGDGKQDLIALEGRYDGPAQVASVVTVWEWNGFGFTLRGRGPHGRFTALAAVRPTQGPDLLFVQGISRR
ncbi:MAG: hypothetical protein PVF70_04415 [Anaerolineales bacterium]|jgi:hypothetical protein